MHYLLVFVLSFVLTACELDERDSNGSQTENNSPQGLKVYVTPNSAYLSWEPVEGADSYNLYWSEIQGQASSGEMKENVVDELSGLIDIEKETTYYLAITAVIGGVESDFSEEQVVLLPSETTNICRNRQVNEHIVTQISSDPMHDFGDSSILNITDLMPQSSSGIINNIAINYKSESPDITAIRFIVQQDDYDYISSWFEPTETGFICHELQYYMDFEQRMNAEIMIESSIGSGEILGITAIKLNPDYTYSDTEDTGMLSTRLDIMKINLSGSLGVGSIGVGSGSYGGVNVSDINMSGSTMVIHGHQ